MLIAEFDTELLTLLYSSIQYLIDLSLSSLYHNNHYHHQRHHHSFIIDPGLNLIPWNLNWKTIIFIQESAFENVICIIVAILSQSQCVNIAEWMSPCLPKGRISTTWAIPMPWNDYASIIYITWKKFSTIIRVVTDQHLFPTSGCKMLFREQWEECTSHKVIFCLITWNNQVC